MTLGLQTERYLNPHSALKGEKTVIGVDMKIIVCVKQIPDPEIPPANFKIDPEKKRAVAPAGKQSLVINPFDEQAVEAALRIKEPHGAKVTALSFGSSAANKVLKHAMAMGADDGILLDVAGIEAYDSYSTALVLAAAIQKIGNYDLILCGRQAGDWDNGQVGLGIAQLLGIPSVTPAQNVEITDGKLRVERVIPEGYEVLELTTPCVIAVSGEIGIPRYATIQGILAASKKEVTVWNARELGLEGIKGTIPVPRIRILKLFIPTREQHCLLIEGETLEEAVANLVLKLRDDKVI